MYKLGLKIVKKAPNWPLQYANIQNFFKFFRGSMPPEELFLLRKGAINPKFSLWLKKLRKIKFLNGV